MLLFTLLTVLLFATIESGLVRESDTSDPATILDGNLYHVFRTQFKGHNVPHIASPDLKKWEDRPDALPKLGKWATTGNNWSPFVFDAGQQYTMWYTAKNAKTGKQDIGVAESCTIDGPYQPLDEPLVPGGYDASYFTENGKRFILYTTGGVIDIQEVNHLGTELKGKPTTIIKADQKWEHSLVQQPTLVKHRSKYVLLYSGMGDDWTTKTRATGFATSAKLRGPYAKPAKPFLTTQGFNKKEMGPGAADVVRGKDGKEYILYHGYGPIKEERSLFVNHLGWNKNGEPVLGVDL